MVADYASTGLTLGPHPLALLRDELPAGTVSVRDLESLRHDAPVRIGGLVVARQRPGTAKGVVFILLEDEFGTVNLVVPPPVYERYRLIVRTEPLLLAEGRLERLPIAGGAINVFVQRLRSLDAPAGEVADVVELASRTAAAAATPIGAGDGPLERPARTAAAAGGSASAGIPDFRGVAPPVQSFAGGRRR
jgi:error-prone DNA polymerase